MKLVSIRIKQFANIVDQKLIIDPRATVLIGKNEVGKTGLLSWFLEQHMAEGGGHGSLTSRLPIIKTLEERGICFDVEWMVEGSRDEGLLRKCLGRTGNKLKVKVEWYPHRKSGSSNIAFELDGGPVKPLESSEVDERTGRRPDLAHELRRALPKIRYIPLPERALPTWEYEFKLLNVRHSLEDRPYGTREKVRTESLMMRLVGLPAMCRWPIDSDKPWQIPGLGRPEHPEELTNAYIRERFRMASEELTRRLRAVWIDPPNLKVEIKLAGKASPKEPYNERDVYCGQFHVTDEAGASHFGTGLRWMLAFLVEVWDIEQEPEDFVVVFDEPGNNLHPSAQKQLVGCLNTLAEERQLIYSTHSPFMIDWHFPYRVRVLHNNWDGTGTHINNKPYASQAPGYMAMWDEVRKSVGAVFGDVGQVGEQNVLVEGVSDQVLLAAMAFRLRVEQKPCIDLNRCKISPFGREEELRRLLAVCKHEGRKVVVITDTDNAGEKYGRMASGEGIDFVGVKECLEAAGDDSNRSVEDLVGLEAYLTAVNDLYSQKGLPWFHCLTVKGLNEKTDSRKNLKNRVNDLFELEFHADGREKPRTYDHTATAVFISEQIVLGALRLDCMPGLQRLLENCTEKLLSVTGKKAAKL